MEDAVEALIKALQEGTAREKAAEALGVIGDARAVEPLSQALQDDNTWFQEVVVRALGKIGKPALKPLMEIVHFYKDWDICMCEQLLSKQLERSGIQRLYSPS